ncbi:hypothetical protein [Microcystis phage Mae-JY04]|uniref:phage tail assembly protein T n=1 Tax=Blastomonas sp. TaxID=1909299 RepID=UPI00258D022F|nr:DUF4035 domain-containing protein [Blastomonas sp.]
MPLPEFRQWQAYAAVNPIGPKRDDWRIAQLAALLFNINRGKSAQPAKVSEFMWQMPREEADPDGDAEKLMDWLGTLPAPPVMN